MYKFFITVYWVRENVLRPIWWELYVKDACFEMTKEAEKHNYLHNFSYSSLKKLIKKYGKSRELIAAEVLAFVQPDIKNERGTYSRLCENYFKYYETPQFYADYCNYDWVVFCWLFGKMIDLPKGFPMYCNDLKAMLDDKLRNMYMTYLPPSGIQAAISSNSNIPLGNKLVWAESLPEYPKEIGAHNSLMDARRAKELFDFITTRL